MAELSAALLTYTLHSSLLLGAAALLRLALGERRLILQEAVLRAALLGGFVTAGLQIGLGVQPWGGVLTLGPAPEVPAPPVAVATAAREAAAPSVAAGSRPPWHSGPLALVILWGVLALIASTRLLVACARLRRLLRGRRPVEDAALCSTVRVLGTRLGLARPVRLTTSTRIAVPVARGVRRAEVCLPAQASTLLDHDQQAALCAHELAHLARHDPAWIVIGHLVAALAPLQPLNLWARRRLQAVAECLSDDLAIAACGERLGLARSLVDVAAWSLAGSSLTPSVAAGAFGSRSGLSHRVERIMDLVRRPERPRRALLPVAAGVALATALLTPVVSGNARTQEAEPPRPAAASDAQREVARLRAQLAEQSRRSQEEIARLKATVEALKERASAEGRERSEIDMRRALARAEAEAAKRNSMVEREALARALEAPKAVLAQQLAAETRTLAEAKRAALLDKGILAGAQIDAERTGHELREATELVQRAVAEARRAAEEARRAAEEALRAAAEVRRAVDPKP